MLEAIGNIGELIAAIATVVTLFYLAIQIRHGAHASQAAAKQALLDTFFDSAWELAGDMERARVLGAGLVAFDSLNERDKTAFTLILGRFVGNIEKGLRLRAAGLIDDSTLEGVATGMVASIRAPGGPVWWQSYRPAANPLVVEYLDRRAANADEPRWDELFPYWAHWASDATPRGESPVQEGLAVARQRLGPIHLGCGPADVRAPGSDPVGAPAGPCTPIRRPPEQVVPRGRSRWNAS